jgi:hypothetical protein
VAFVKDKFHFFMNKAPTKNEIYTSKIQSVIEDEIVSCLMAYTSTLIARSRGGDLQIMDID